MSAPTPRVAVIVLTWCNEEETAACIESLLAVEYPQVSVLLVDNASPDGSGERLHRRFAQVDYLQTGANLGYAAGNNRGITRALAGGAEYLLILNDDTVVDPTAIGVLVAAAQETGAAVVAPRILYFDDPSIIWYGGGYLSRARALGLHALQDETAATPQLRSATAFVTGCCFLIRADAVREAGGFDESYFMYGEDVDLSMRLSAAGHQLMYEPRATVLHRVGRRLRPSPFQIRQRERNRRRLVRRHYGLADHLRFSAWFYPTRAIHLLRYALSGKGAHASAIVAGTFGDLDTPVATPSTRSAG